jgi:hypothetical protein
VLKPSCSTAQAAAAPICVLTTIMEIRLAGTRETSSPGHWQLA